MRWIKVIGAVAVAVAVAAVWNGNTQGGSTKRTADELPVHRLDRAAGGWAPVKMSKVVAGDEIRLGDEATEYYVTRRPETDGRGLWTIAAFLKEGRVVTDRDVVLYNFDPATE